MKSAFKTDDWATSLPISHGSSRSLSNARPTAESPLEIVTIRGVWAYLNSDRPAAALSGSTIIDVVFHG